VLWLLSPRWLLLHVGTLAALALTVVLGQWQMNAYVARERQEQQAAAAAALATEPVPVDSVVAAGEPLTRPALGTLVTLTGEFVDEATLLLPGRRLDDDDGWYVVTPVRDEAGDLTPVLRGWVPAEDDPARAAPVGQVTVTGVVAETETDADAQVDPRTPLPAGQAAALSSTVLFQTYPAGPAQIRQALVVAVDEQPSSPGAPARVSVEQAVPVLGGVAAWRHLSYAWQWWLFGAAAIVFWVAFVRAGFRDRRGTPEEPAPAAPAASGPG
jgi:cytochrome oxidase assembly protein ShyY1